MTSRVGSSPDILFVVAPLQHSLVEEGVLDQKLTSKQIREEVEAAGGGEVKTSYSKALSEEVDEYTPGVYHRFSDKRFLSAQD